MRFFLSLLLSLVFVACSQAERRNELPGFEHIVVVGTNDVHGHLRVQEKSFGAQTLYSGGSEWFAGYVNTITPQQWAITSSTMALEIVAGSIIFEC